MRCMSITPRPGMKATTHYVSSYGLPDDLEVGETTTVISFSNGYCDVRDASGREFKLLVGCVDRGTLYEIDHRWLPSDHPYVIEERARDEAAMSPLQRTLMKREEDWGKRPERRMAGANSP